MKTRFELLYVWFLLGAHFGFADGQEAKTLLNGVQSAREQVPPSRLTLERTYHSELIHNEFVDVIEFDEELRRYENTCTIPTRTNYTRAVFDGKEALIYHGAQVAIYNLSDSDGTCPLYDPRILGIAGALTSDKTIIKCFPYQFSSKLETIGPEDIEGTPTRHVQMTFQNGTLLDWWIDIQNNFRVLRYSEKWPSGSRSVRSWYENPQYHWLPSRILAEDFGSNGGITSREEIKTVKAEANIKFPKSTWTLQGFNLPPKTVVTDTRSHTFGYWMNGRVMSAEEWNRLPPKGLQPIPWSGRRVAVIVVLAVALATPLIFLLLRSKRNEQTF
jgi:hypothetical protein